MFKGCRAAATLDGRSQKSRFPGNLLHANCLGRIGAFTGAVLVLIGSVSLRGATAPETFTVATFNIENYLDKPQGTRRIKSEESRAKVRESIRALNPDVIGLQEIGGTNALQELRASLKAEGLDYPYWEHVPGFDHYIQVAVLSRFPITARRSHSNEGFLLNGRRFRTTRGIAELDIRVSPKYSFTVMVAHLKSRRPSAHADESEIREQEALILREKIDARLKADPKANLVLVGDLNDIKGSPATRAVIGKGKLALLDTRPAERNGDPLPAARSQSNSRNVTWTHFFAAEDTYSRVDYLFVSPGMAREWEPAGTYVLTLPNWGLASDHRPIIARFAAMDK